MSTRDTPHPQEAQAMARTYVDPGAGVSQCEACGGPHRTDDCKRLQGAPWRADGPCVDIEIPADADLSAFGDLVERGVELLN